MRTFTLQHSKTEIYTPHGEVALVGHVALDIDIFPIDNSQTSKEGVSYTYKDYDGYAPIAAYLGTESWCLSF
jgi:hypothetical protein